jgi:transcription initiation factor TFIID subunit 9B
MVLASLGLSAYQERVPLQLLDFAYRYTTGVLQDALHLSSEAYSTTTGRSTLANSSGEMNNVNLAALQLAIRSRLNYQFQPHLGKEFLLEQAHERNRVGLPRVGAQEWGVRLPPERFCLTGVGWGLKDEWDSEGEEERDQAEQDQGGGKEVVMGGMEKNNDEKGVEDDEDEGRLEDLFGDDIVDEGDADMEDV